MTPKTGESGFQTITECRAIHKTLQWASGVVAGILFSIIIIAFAFAFSSNREVGEQSVKVRAIEQRVDKLEAMNDKLDQILRKVSE